MLCNDRLIKSQSIEQVLSNGMDFTSAICATRGDKIIKGQVEKMKRLSSERLNVAIKEQSGKGKAKVEYRILNIRILKL